MDGGAWWATVHGVAKSQTRLSDFTSLRASDAIGTFSTYIYIYIYIYIKLYIVCDRSSLLLLGPQ